MNSSPACVVKRQTDHQSTEYNFNEDPDFKLILNDFQEFWKHIRDVKQQQKKIKAECLQKQAKESKFVAEMQQNSILKQKLIAAQEQDEKIKKMCEAMINIDIRDSDKERLEKAQDMIKICKKVTGVRFDYSAPSSVYKGYIKNELHKILEPFEIEESPQTADTLWSIIQAPLLQDVEDLVTAEVLDPKHN